MPINMSGYPLLTGLNIQSDPINSALYDPAGELSKMYLKNPNGGDAFNVASKSINDSRTKAIQDLLSRYSTTGLNRTGITGAAVNQINQGADVALGNAAVTSDQAAQQRRLNILSMLLGYKQNQDNQAGFGDFLGAGLGTLVGAATGGLGTSIGNKIGSLL